MRLPPLMGYADVGRSGLGNMLFPWARCVLWCDQNKMPMVAPLWFRIRVGPYLRRERDKRSYQRYFKPDVQMTGIRRLLALTTLPRLPEPDSPMNSVQRSGVVLFRGMGKLFCDLRGHAETIAASLVRITRPQYRPAPRNEPSIAVHVRLGDFSVPSAPSVLQAGHHNYRLPVDWYVGALKTLRARLGELWPAVLFSDGPTSELEPLLREPNVVRASGRHAITDLIAMSRSTVLIASGSTFSMWASYLGQVPTIWYPGQRRQFVLGIEDSGELEPEWGGGPLSQCLVGAALNRAGDATPVGFVQLPLGH